jgi:non-ribosomal peptide synthetase component F
MLDDKNNNNNNDNNNNIRLYHFSIGHDNNSLPHSASLNKISSANQLLPSVNQLLSSSLLPSSLLRSSSSSSSSSTTIIRSTESLAYVLYTSGSTGKPKGVMVRNQGLTNIIKFFANHLDVRDNDMILGLTTFCFDISMLEIFLPLIKGATLVLVSLTTQKNPILIKNTLKKYDITIMQATPTTYEMLLSSDWNGDMKMTCLVGGEACRPKVAQLSSKCRGLYNVYGPTGE